MTCGPACDKALSAVSVLQASHAREEAEAARQERDAARRAASEAAQEAGRYCSPADTQRRVTAPEL